MQDGRALPAILVAYEQEAKEAARAVRNLACFNTPARLDDESILEQYSMRALFVRVGRGKDRRSMRGNTKPGNSCTTTAQRMHCAPDCAAFAAS